jgi:ribosomal protein S18 acetylase RimI-like enzyme
MNLLPALTKANLLQRNFAIRRATADDVPAIEKIARQYPKELAFVRRNSLLEAMRKQSLHVAVFGAVVVGFVSFYARRDGWHTVYDLATDKRYAGLGVGRQLLYSVPCPVRLKTTVDNERANRFYLHAGMVLSGTESGKNRALNVYEMRVLSILCAGNNHRFPEVAVDSGMAYGTRHDDTPRDYPFMVDINWKSYQWTDYMNKIRSWRPVMAMVADYESPLQRNTMLKQVHALRRSGVLRIMVCPKFDGAVSDIPQDCIIAVSVPTSYAGFVPQMRELTGRKVHLLGGSPVKQREIMKQINAFGQVISTDGNAHTGSASNGMFWRDGRWQTDKQEFDYYDLCKLSGRNIQRMMQYVAGYQQLQLF